MSWQWLYSFFISRRLRPEFVASCPNSLDPDAQPPLNNSASATRESAGGRSAGTSLPPPPASSSAPSCAAPSIYHDANATRWQQVVDSSVTVRTKIAREVAKRIVGEALRAHADAAVGVLLSLYPWSRLADVVSLRDQVCFALKPFQYIPIFRIVAYCFAEFCSEFKQGHTELYCCNGLTLCQRPFKGYRDALQEIDSRLEVDIKTARNRFEMLLRVHLVPQPHHSAEGPSSPRPWVSLAVCPAVSTIQVCRSQCGYHVA